MATKARCMKCKEEREMKDEQQTSVKGRGGSTRPAVKGKCPQCDTTMFKFVKKADSQKKAA